ncbi:MAG TPA: alkaline phosphatase family protein [Gemmatimonadales bacterium]|nr:alkaline phosphatase family protein [Gemmatimonadales bacterium]
MDVTPHPAHNRVVFVLIDGARHDVLRALLDRGDLPNLARWVLEPGGTTVGTTVFPSTTGVAYVPFLFGRYPGSADVPGIRWLDRAGAAGSLCAQWQAARSYCGAQAAWIDRDIACGPSIFELVRDSLAICTPIVRGLRPGAHLLPLRRAVLGIAAHYLGTYPALDRAVAEAWVAAARAPWRFLFVVFPGPDGLTHLHGPVHPLVLDAYRQIDRALGRFLARLRGTGEAPALFVSADHGASVVREHCDIAEELERRSVPTIRHPLHVWRRSAQAAVMVSGNGCAHVYFRPRSGRPTPRAGVEVPSDLIEELVGLPAVHLAAWRGGPGEVMVARGWQRACLGTGDDEISYEALLGDPLELGAARLSLADRELLARSRETPFPDAARQLLQLFRSPRAGDVVLAAAPGSDFRGAWEIPEHRAGHGSLIPEHLEVPIAASVPLPREPIRTVDVMPTMLEILGVPVPDGLDGVAFSRLGAQAAVA